MCKNLLAKYYQENKERLRKKFVKDNKIFLEKKKKKKRQYGRELYKISQKISQKKL